MSVADGAAVESTSRTLPIAQQVHLAVALVTLPTEPDSVTWQRVSLNVFPEGGFVAAGVVNWIYYQAKTRLGK